MTMATTPTPQARASQLLEALFSHERRAVHRLLVVLLVLEWIGLVGLAGSHTHALVARGVFPWAFALASIGGGLATLVPLVLVQTHPDAPITRHAVAAGQMLASALFIHVADGRIEPHFHVFGSLALLAFYRDPKVLLTATALVVADTAWDGWADPFVDAAGHLGRARMLEQAGWAVFESAVLALGIAGTERESRALALRQVELEAAERAPTEQLRAEHDEVERARAESELRRAAEESVEARTAFVRALSHELRTPLNAVVGFIELLGCTRLTPDQEEHLMGARTSAHHVLDLIGDVLDHAKIESGKLELERAPFSVGDVVASALTLVENGARAKKLRLELFVAPDVPAYLVGDVLRVRQVLLNLLGNAIKFTPEGRVRVRVSRLADGDGVVFDVQDDGVGIAESARERVFDPYRQASARVARTHGGTGLGLSISRRLARAMGGDLTFDSVVGAGTTFHFVAPLRAAAAPARTPTRYSQLAPPPVSPQRLRVLFADDDATNRLVGRQLLEVLGHRVDTVDGGVAALTALERASYDLVLMDVEMPDLDGLEATRRTRARGIATPILAFTAHDSRRHDAACREAGMNGVLHKPIDLGRLTTAIAHVTARANGRIATGEHELAHVDPPKETPMPTPELDLAALRARLGGDESLMSDVLAAIRNESEQLANDLRAALDRKDMPAARRAAHTLRGCVANVGAKHLATLLTPIEDAAEHDDAARVAELAPAALAAWDALRTELATADDAQRRAA